MSTSIAITYSIQFSNLFLFFYFFWYVFVFLNNERDSVSFLSDYKILLVVFFLHFIFSILFKTYFTYILLSYVYVSLALIIYFYNSKRNSKNHSPFINSLMTKGNYNTVIIYSLLFFPFGYFFTLIYKIKGSLIHFLNMVISLILLFYVLFHIATEQIITPIILIMNANVSFTAVLLTRWKISNDYVNIRKDAELPIFFMIPWYMSALMLLFQSDQQNSHSAIIEAISNLKLEYTTFFYILNAWVVFYFFMFISGMIKSRKVRRNDHSASTT